MNCRYKNKLWDNRWCPVACYYCVAGRELTCPSKKPAKQSNADRIRAVSDSDEELAKCIYEIGFDCHLCSEHERLSDNPLLRHEKCDEKCVEHCLEWLQQPAEVE